MKDNSQSQSQSHEEIDKKIQELQEKQRANQEKLRKGQERLLFRQKQQEYLSEEIEKQIAADIPRKAQKNEEKTTEQLQREKLEELSRKIEKQLGIQAAIIPDYEQSGSSGVAPNNENDNKMDPWGRKLKVISQKSSKKRVLVEWNFVTSDGAPHTIVLQHTQDSKVKTRRMLWVDQSEKYNNKSSASSFRIEIDQDVVVVQIEATNGPEKYEYRLTINGKSYVEAFSEWKEKKEKNG